ncbi:MAG: alpha/beta hydrolase [Chloroflexi bacterium]|nr:alpha/beta hydrolase [Chloroflexota bacterium]
MTLDGISEATISTNRISTRILSSGDGEPAIFLHGNVSTATFWEETMLALPDGFRAIAYDQRGFGGADINKKIDATRGMGDLSDDLKALMDKLGYEQAHLVGHSAGGSVLWRFMMDYPEMCKTVTLVDPGSPYGFGGTRGLDGTPNWEDHAGSGGGTVNPDFAKALAARDTSEEQGSPLWTLRSFYFKPPFIPDRERELLESMFDTHVGEQDYPGDMTPSENWPNVAPGKWGLINALSRKYLKDPKHLYDVEEKPPVLWIRGADDQIVSNTSFFDLATLGKLGLVPGYPGESKIPSQQMVGQTRVVLEAYQDAGGSYQELVISDAGHTPYIEKPDEFNTALHTFIGA